MRSSVGSILVFALFAVGCEEASEPTSPTEVGDWRGSPGFDRPDPPGIDVTSPPEKPANSGWEKLPPLGTNLPAKLIIGPDRRPIVLHTHAHAIAGQTLINLDVSKHDGQAWVRYPAISEMDSGHYGYSIALSSDGDPVVAWTEATPTGNVVRVSSFAATGWDHSLPPLSGTAPIAHDPVVRLDGGGRPVVTWQENDWPSPVTQLEARWNGTTWDRSDLRPIPDPVPNDALRPRSFRSEANWDALLAYASDGTAYAVWTVAAERSGLGVARWDGRAWEARSGFDLASTPSALCQLTVDASGTVWVVWTDEGGTRVNVAKSKQP